MFCLPVPKDKFQTTTPWAISTIVIIDALLLIPLYTSDKISFFSHYAFTPSHPTPLTLFTALFLHVGLLHYVGNMWFLWIFGRKVECTLGTLRFAALYLLCGVGGQLLHLLLNLHSNLPLLGASGAISGIAGFYFFVFPRDRFNLHLYFGWWRIQDDRRNNPKRCWCVDRRTIRSCAHNSGRAIFECGVLGSRRWLRSGRRYRRYLSSPRTRNITTINSVGCPRGRRYRRTTKRSHYAETQLRNISF